MDARIADETNFEDKLLPKPESMLYLADEERLIIDVRDYLKCLYNFNKKIFNFI